MKKYIAILFVIFILVGLSVLEEITIDSYLNDIQTQSQELMDLTKGTKNIQTEEIILKVNELEKTWVHHEEILCLVANHKDMRDLCIEIQRLKGNIEVNQYEDFTASLKIINHLSQDYHKIMGISWQNIF